MTTQSLSSHEKLIMLSWVKSSHPAEHNHAQALPDELFLQMYDSLMPAGQDYELAVRLHRTLMADQNTHEGTECIKSFYTSILDVERQHRPQRVPGWYESVIWERFFMTGYSVFAMDWDDDFSDRSYTVAFSQAHSIILSALIYHDVEEEVLRIIRQEVLKYVEKT